LVLALFLLVRLFHPLGVFLALPFLLLLFGGLLLFGAPVSIVPFARFLLLLLGVLPIALVGIVVLFGFPLPVLAGLVRLALLFPGLLLPIRFSLLVLLLLALLILLLTFLVLFLLVLLLLGLGLLAFFFFFLVVASRLLEGHLVVRALGDIRVREVASVA